MGSGASKYNNKKKNKGVDLSTKGSKSGSVEDKCVIYNHTTEDVKLYQNTGQVAETGPEVDNTHTEMGASTGSSDVQEKGQEQEKQQMGQHQQEPARTTCNSNGNSEGLQNGATGSQNICKQANKQNHPDTSRQNPDNVNVNNAENTQTDKSSASASPLAVDETVNGAPENTQDAETDKNDNDVSIGCVVSSEDGVNKYNSNTENQVPDNSTETSNASDNADPTENVSAHTRQGNKDNNKTEQDTLTNEKGEKETGEEATKRRSEHSVGNKNKQSKLGGEKSPNDPLSTDTDNTQQDDSASKSSGARRTDGEKLEKDKLNSSVDNDADRDKLSKQTADPPAEDVNKQTQLSSTESTESINDTNSGQTETGEKIFTNKLDDYEIEYCNDNLLFYSNEKCSKPFPGYLIEDMLEWKGDYDQLERSHSYIQWLFPIPDSRGTNMSAQPLCEHEAQAIRKSVELKSRVLKAFEMMLDFYGMRLVDEEKGEIKRADNWRERYEHLDRSIHNRYRITRILKSLGELGFEHLQAPWVKFLIREATTEQGLPSLNGNSIEHWIETVKNDEEIGTLLMLLHAPVSNRDDEQKSDNVSSENTTASKPDNNDTAETGDVNGLENGSKHIADAGNEADKISKDSDTGNKTGTDGDNSDSKTQTDEKTNENMVVEGTNEVGNNADVGKTDTVTCVGENERDENDETKEQDTMWV